LVSPQPTQPNYLPLNSTYRVPWGFGEKTDPAPTCRWADSCCPNSTSNGAQYEWTNCCSIWSQHFLKGDGRDLRTVQNEESQLRLSS